MINKEFIPEITSDKLYTNSNNDKVDQNGLLSEVIFGPLKDYKCACGKLSSKTLHEGQTCPDCGVTCQTKNARYNEFGKIKLPFFVINSLNKNKFNRITKRDFKSFLNPNQQDLISTLQVYLEYNLTNDAIQLTNVYNPNCLPLKITGLYSLFLGINAIKIVYPTSKSAVEFLEYFYNELLVMPPECRVTVNQTENSRTLITHKITNIYQSILRIKNYVIRDNKNIETEFLDYLNLLVDRFSNGEDEIINDIKITNYDSITSKFQYYVDILYEEILISLSGKSGLIRSDFLGKSIDFSSRAVVVNDPSLAAHQIKIPKEAFLKLWFFEYISYSNKINSNVNKLMYENTNNLLKPVVDSSIHIDFNKYPKFNEFADWIIKEGPRENRLLYINRQPTLWRYGLLGVEVVGLNDNYVTSVSPLIIPSLAMDFDGDTAALYKVHDHRSIKELYDNSFVMNLITYDHNDSFLTEISNEAKYGYEVLRSSTIDSSHDTIEVDRLENLKYDHKVHLNTSVHIKNIQKEVPYGIALLNKFAGLKNILITSNVESSAALKIIFENSLSNEKFQNSVRLFLINIYWFLTTHSSETLTLPFIESAEFVNKVKHNKLLSKLPQNPYLGSYIYHAVVDGIYNSIPKNYQLHKLTKAKFRKNSFSRGLISIGYIADNHNMISPTPVKSNIITGLTEDEFFETSFGTRKGIVDKDENVPDAGYMQRSMVINLSSLEIVEDDCKTSVGFKIKIQTPTHNKSMLNRYFFNEDGNISIYDESYAYDNSNIGKVFTFRSPITCQTDNFKVCAKCVGKQKFTSPFIGVMTGQYVEERLTQLTMSSFHTSGSATISLDNQLKDYIQLNLCDIHEHENNIIIKFKEPISKEIVTKFEINPNFKFIKQLSECELLFEKYLTKIENEDVGKIIKKVNSILATQTQSNMIPLHEAYNETLSALHKVSNIHSVFVELLLANSYVNESNKIIRYAIRDGEDFKITKKYNTKQLHKLQSSTLSLIYEPNKNSILNYYLNPTTKNSNLSIFEKIWNGQI